MYKIEFPRDVRRIIDLLSEYGYDSYAVGGCIRDTIRGCTPSDWDITTSARPADMLRLFAEGDIRVIGTAGIRHGTVMLKGPDGVYEVTTFRCDGDYKDHRRPDIVTFSDKIEDDLARRDFTMNAIAAKPLDNGIVIVDPFGGADDIRDGVIRTVGDPCRRFDEDALRILRGIRFASVLGFTVEDNTANRIIEKHNTLEYVAFERITAELWKFLCGSNVSPVASQFVKVFEWITGGSLSDRFLAHIGDTDDPYVRLALMLDHGSDPSAFFLRARFPAETAKVVRGLLAMTSAPENRIHVCRMMRKFGDGFSTAAEYLSILKSEGIVTDGLAGEELLRASDGIIADGIPYTLAQLNVRGGDIIAAGVPAEYVGNALEYLLEEVQTGNIPNEKAALISAIPSI